VTAPTTQRRRVTQRFPALIPARMAQRRLTKRVQDARAGYRYAIVRSDADLPWLVAEHASILERDLQGVDPRLQRNKVTNLRLAAGRIDGVIMAPGETFSFWRLVGRATERGGYTDGLVLRDGEAASGVGGGLCQISNMLHWLALHSDLTVSERHRHSFDPFPDSERRVPFGTGATLLDGIFDLKVTNGTSVDHQFRLRFTDTQLVGELRAAERPSVRYEVVEREHRFVRADGEVFRDNRIVRLGFPMDPAPGAEAASAPVSEVELFANHCRVGYQVDDDQIS
jgi:vancomycin resistance protein VanW